MKFNKTISLDSEFIDELRDVNASELINKLLKEYFINPKSAKKEITEEIDKLKKRSEQLDYENQKIIDKQQKEEEVKQTLSSFNLPEDILSWLRLREVQPTIIAISEKLHSLNIKFNSEIKNTIIEAWLFLKS